MAPAVHSPPANAGVVRSFSVPKQSRAAKLLSCSRRHEIFARVWQDDGSRCYVTIPHAAHLLYRHDGPILQPTHLMNHAEPDTRSPNPPLGYACECTLSRRQQIELVAEFHVHRIRPSRIAYRLGNRYCGSGGVAVWRAG